MTRALAAIVYDLLVTEFDAPAIGKTHFVDRWMHAPDYFAHSLGKTHFTFRAERDRWYVTTFGGEVPSAVGSLFQPLEVAAAA